MGDADMPDWVRVLLPKVAGYLIGLLAAWLSTKGISVPPEHQAEMSLFVVAIFISIGGAVKTWISAHINPGNVNSPKLASVIHEDKKNASN